MPSTGTGRIYHDEPAGVRHYLKGYAAAGLTAYELLTGALAVLEDHGYVDEELIAASATSTGAKSHPPATRHPAPRPKMRARSPDEPATVAELRQGLRAPFTLRADERLCAAGCARMRLETIEHELRARAAHCQEGRFVNGPDAATRDRVEGASTGATPPYSGLRSTRMGREPAEVQRQATAPVNGYIADGHGGSPRPSAPTCARLRCAEAWVARGASVMTEREINEKAAALLRAASPTYSRATSAR